jgi:tRNA threonylcarbamoyladenosine biosynthesis protein TsaB
MQVIAVDTCDSRGSVAVVRNAEVLTQVNHESAEDYSVWLLPAVNAALQEAGVTLREVEGYAVSAGPGSFTGVRAGLTTVKAWAEVYGKPIAAVSRLEAIAALAWNGTPFAAACADARRSQVFGAVYRRTGGVLERIGDEMVIAPGKFVDLVAGVAGAERVSWASTDPGILVGAEEWCPREKLDERLESVSPFLAVAIGRIGMAQIKLGHVADALTLDANYVRRTDAELHWNGTTKKAAT